MNPTPSEGLLSAMDKVVEEQIQEVLQQHGNNLWTLNVICTSNYMVCRAITD